MKASIRDVLREAAKEQHPNETFEKALSRTVRKRQGTYQDYIDLIGQVRNRARRDRSSLLDAAKAMAQEQ